MNGPDIDPGELNDSLPSYPNRAPETLALSLAVGPEGEGKRKMFCRQQREQNARLLTSMIKSSKGVHA